ncbi:response regulator [Stagnimonas aquatica]|uniref:Sensory/regulatory protein RpfC n=1 Tax=Stagnimonas aquatica TaxID=2689987 RepID=A0A3N0VA01_9GAMM|nr:PAS domain-containing protein [Stagnimonas aquatica]ROH89607.1 response regulator [Stagnimonas aquatica]
MLNRSGWRRAMALIPALLLAWPAQALKLSAEETAWLAQHPVVTVYSDAGAPPFDAIDEQGRHFGLVTDYLQELAERTGLRFQWSPQPRRARLLAQMANDDQAQLLVAYALEVPPGAGLRPFARVLAQDYPVLVSRRLGADYDGLGAGRARRYALVSGYAPGERYGARQPGSQLLYSENFEPALVDVALGNADASVQGLAVADYLIRQRGLGDLQFSGLASEPAQPLRWWLPANATVLAGLLERAWDEIPEPRHRHLRETWLGEERHSAPPPAEDAASVWPYLLLPMLLLVAGWYWYRRRALRQASPVAPVPRAGYGPGLMFELEEPPAAAPRLRDCSPEVLHYLGLAADTELPALATLRAGIPAEDQALIAEAVAESRPGLRRCEVEFRLAGKDGLRWVKCTAEPRRQADGGLLWQAVAVDITAQKLAEAQSERAERRLREITDNVPEVVFQLERDAQGSYRFNFVSASLLSICGLSPQEVMRDSEAIFHAIHEDDRERVRAAVQRSALGLEAYEVEYRLRRPDGQLEWLRASARPLRLGNGSTVWNGYISNVSRLKQVEQRLEEAERFVRDITDNIPGFVYQLRQNAETGERRLSFISAGVSSHGLSAAEALAEQGRIYARLPPEDQQSLSAAVARSMETLTPYRLDYRVQLPSGVIGWMRTQAAPRRLPDGSLVWNGVTNEISEEKLLQAEAQRAQERLKAITDALPGVVYQRLESLSGEVAYPYISDVASEVFEMAAEDIARRPELLRERTVAEDLVGITEALAASRRERSLVSLDFRFRRRNGELRWLRTRCRPAPSADSEIMVWNGFTEDVTAEREAQARAEALQRRLVEITATVPCVVFQLRREADGRQRLLFVSDSLLDLAGVSQQAAEADIQALWARLPPEDAELLDQALQRSQRERQPLHYDFRLRGADGRLRWVRGALSLPREDAEGTVWSGTWQDISDIKALQDQLAQAKRAAESASRMKSEFLANMSHEIRTPMNAIIGLGQLALQTELSPRQRDYIGKIQTASQSLLGIISDILDLSKIEAGRMQLERVEFDLNHVLEDLAGLIGLRAAEKSLDLRFELPTDLPTRLIGDPLRLGQVLLNLASNAIKFSDAGEVCLRIREAGREGSGLRLRFELRDQGIGLSAEQIRRLFESFAQGDATTTRKYGGTGLGLSISRNLVRLMGGEIGVESSPGQGSCFHFDALLELPAGEQPRYRLPPDLQGCRALVVDGRRGSAELLVSWLKAYGCRAEPVATGELALARLAQAGTDPYRLLLLDWDLPGLSGVETVQRLYGLGLAPRPALVMLSSLLGEAMTELAKASGVQAFLSRPAIPAGLFRAVLRALGHPESPSASEPPEPVRPLAGLRVLAADDNEVNLQVEREILESAGARVGLARNGLEVLARLAEEPFDVVLLDLQMPELDGLATVRKLRADSRYRRMPVIAMTAHAMPEDRQQALAAGMSDYLSKPVARDALVLALQRAQLGLPPPAVAGSDLPAVVSATEGALVDAALLDAEGAIRHLGGNRDLYRRLVERFQRDHHQAAEQITGALGGQDWERARREAHSLRGVAANLGALRLAGLAGEIEQALRQDQQPSGEQLARLQQTQQQTLAAMQALEEASAPPERDVAIEAGLASQLQQLARLLAEHDAEAKVHFSGFSARLAQSATPAFLRLRMAIDNYDFETAALALDDLMHELNLPLAATPPGTQT